MSEIRVDTISEKTSANGVAIDGVTIKDGGGTFTSPVLVPDGSTSAVSLGNDGDPNTGIYFQAADSLGLVLGGSRKLSATSAGIAIENGTLSAKGGAVFNEDSADVDFRVESNGNANMLFVNGGTDRVGIATNAPTKQLGIGGTGDISLEGSSNAIAFYDSAALKAYITSQSFGDHNGDGLGIVTSGEEPIKFFTNGGEQMRLNADGILSLNEAAPDGTDGSLCLNQAGGDGKILSFKSSDVDHGMTGILETDTYATFQKQSASLGGLQIRSFAGNHAAERLVINCQGEGDVTEATSTSTKGAICFISSNKSGVSNGSQNANGNLMSIANYTTTRFLFEGNGDFHADAGSNTFDEYEDAHLVRAYDLSHMKGVINSKFDKFVAYNHEKLADLRLVGREEDGTPNHFINVTGMQRLHNGAIWQQYEKHQRLAEAVYEMAKETLGKDKADAILEKHDIKLLN